MLKQSLIGLFFLILITLENLILARRKTIPVMLCDQLFVSGVVYFFFGWITLIYSGLLLLFLGWIKWRNKNVYESDLDFGNHIFSMSSIYNKIHRPVQGKMVVGTIFPVNHSEIKYNDKKIELDDIVMSGETLVTGSTGSGKNLYKDTIIPTINGNKRLEDIQIGDTIFDKNGIPTRVIDKYSPKDNKFYEITLSDNTKIKAGSGHLWEVEFLHERQLKSHIKSNLAEVNISLLRECTNTEFISRQDFVKKYFSNFNYWYTFLVYHAKSFSRFNKDDKYISIDKIIKYTEESLNKPYAKRKELLARLQRLNDYKQINKTNFINASEAQKLLLTKWQSIIINSGINLVDHNRAFAIEKDACNEVLGLINDLYRYEQLENDNTQKCKVDILSTQEIVDYINTNKYKGPFFAIRRPKACQYNKIDLPIKPYWLGAWLGDGSKWEAAICGTDLEVGKRLEQDYKFRKVIVNKPVKENYLPITSWFFTAEVRTLLRQNNLRGNKHIPDIYKIASIEDKLELIAGLIDTDGSVDADGTCGIGLINENIIKSLREICCSLGFKCSEIKCEKGVYTDNNKRVECQLVFGFSFFPNVMLPLQVPRKRDRLQNRINKLQKNELTQQVRHKRFYITNIEEIKGNYKDYYCLAVDSDTHMFLCTESYVPTHNTTTLKTILIQRINDHRPVVFVDYKGEEDILNDIKGYASAAGLPYYEFSARDCNFTYDPFINLNETGKVEALMNTRRWSTDGADEHYKTSMQLAIQNLVREYDAYRAENNEKTNYIVGLYNFALHYQPQANERDGFANLLKSLEILLSSRAKDLFGDEPDFTFENDQPYVVCFSFTSANKALANQLSSFVFSDIMDRGTRKRYPDKLLLCVDEFGTLESSTLIKDLLEKGRSGGVQTVFSILDLNQISMTSGEFFTQSILGTINNYIIHAGATQSTADLLAGVQKYDKEFDIMSLRKPYRGKKPTALFITKYNILNKRNNQEVFRMIPYSKVLHNKIDKTERYHEEPVDKPENYIIPVEELDLTQPIDNIDQYL